MAKYLYAFAVVLLLGCAASLIAQSSEAKQSGKMARGAADFPPY